MGLPMWFSGKDSKVVTAVCLPMREMEETRVQSLGQEDPLEE